MTRAALVLAVLASPAVAEDVLRHSWGIPTEGDGPNVLTLAPCPEEPGCWAVLSYHNTLILGLSAASSATLRMDGLDVGVSIVQGDGRVPEVLVVQPPYGFRAEPGEVEVPDGGEVEVRVYVVPVG